MKAALAFTLVLFALCGLVVYSLVHSRNVDRARATERTLVRLQQIADLQQAKREDCLRLHRLDLVLEQQIEQSLVESLTYLRKYPKGAPGIPRDLILRGISRSRNTLALLRLADCTEKGQT